MERRVKERLIGATVLVAFIVAIVPEFLSGPKPHSTAVPPQAAVSPMVVAPAEPVRSVTVDLATSKATADAGGAVEELPPPASAATESAAPAAPAPGMQVMTPSPPTPAAPATAAAPGSIPEHQPAARAVENNGANPRSEPVTPATGRAWAVQLGSFASRANAEKLLRRVRTHDSRAYLSPSGRGTNAHYRVRIGPLADRNIADRVVVKLKNEGLSASLIPP